MMTNTREKSGNEVSPMDLSESDRLDGPVCPISHELLSKLDKKDMLEARDGHVYKKDALIGYLDYCYDNYKDSKSPMNSEIDLGYDDLWEPSYALVDSLDAIEAHKTLQQKMAKRVSELEEEVNSLKRKRDSEINEESSSKRTRLDASQNPDYTKTHLTQSFFLSDSKSIKLHIKNDNTMSIKFYSLNKDSKEMQKTSRIVISTAKLDTSKSLQLMSDHITLIGHSNHPQKIWAFNLNTQQIKIANLKMQVDQIGDYSGKLRIVSKKRMHTFPLKNLWQVTKSDDQVMGTHPMMFRENRVVVKAKRKNVSDKKQDVNSFRM